MNISREPEGALPHARLTEAAGIVAICFGWFILASVQVVSTRGAAASDNAGFSDAGLDATLVSELILAAVAMAVLWGRRYPLHSLWPQASWRGALAGIGLYLGMMVVVWAGALLVPDPSHYPIAEMMKQSHVSWSSVVPVSLVNGTYEEVFLLGYLMRGLRRYGGSTAVGVTVLVRMLYHMYQGPAGVLSVALCGIVFGAYFQRTGRLFPVVLAHIIADMAAFLLWSEPAYSA
jgi:membrane protease YdiL (CAAX protease family)